MVGGRATTLRGADYEALLELVGELHDASSTAELREVLLPALRRLTPATYTSYNEVFGDGRPPEFVVDPEVPATLAPTWRRLGHTNPLLRRYLRTRDGRPYRFSDVIDLAELRSLPLFTEFYRPLGIEHQIAFALPAPRDVTIAIVLSRNEPDFTDRERELLDLARPHIIQAYRNAQFREQTDRLERAVEQGVELGRLAVIVSDAGGRVEFVSDEARSVAEDSGLAAPVVDRPLPGWLHTAVPDGADAGSLTVDGDVLLVRRARRPGTATLVLDRARRALSPATLHSLGLTPRESEVLATIATGRDGDATAEFLGIEPRTVQKHLQRIYAKLGVRGRSQAVATAWAAAGTTASLAP